MKMKNQHHIYVINWCYSFLHCTQLMQNFSVLFSTLVGCGFRWNTLEHIYIILLGHFLSFVWLWSRTWHWVVAVVVYKQWCSFTCVGLKCRLRAGKALPLASGLCHWLFVETQQKENPHSLPLNHIHSVWYTKTQELVMLLFCFSFN